jgi:photosystem II stability/assembly factor-like uncharacterized protein
MRKITLIIACFFTLSFQSCYEESFIQTIEPKRGWEVQNSGTKYTLTDVFFIDENTGWVVSIFDTVLKTTDGGKTWKKYHCENIYSSYASIFFTDKSNGWLAGANGKLMRTTDGGETWKEKIYNTDNSWNGGNLHSLSFTASGTGAFTDEFGTIYFTHDNGETWSIRRGEEWDYIGTVVFINNLNGWANGSHRNTKSDSSHKEYTLFMLRTTDGGITWEKSQDSSKQLDRFKFIDENLGWAVKDNYFVKTTDGGQTWHKRGDTLTNFRNYFFTDEQNGWLIEFLPRVRYGSREYYPIKRTQDGGLTWQYQNMPAYQNGNYVELGQMHFINSRVGWAVGDYGSIWHTKTGGEPE